MKTVNDYIAGCEAVTAKKLSVIRELIFEVVPDVEERIAWGVPTYYHKGYLLQIAGNKNHIGFYVTPHVIAQCHEELMEMGLKTNAKNTLYLPLDQPLPEELLRRMIRLRYLEVKNDKE